MLLSTIHYKFINCYMYVNVMVAPRLKKSFIHLFVVILTIAESSEIVIPLHILPWPLEKYCYMYNDHFWTLLGPITSKLYTYIGPQWKVTLLNIFDGVKGLNQNWFTLLGDVFKCPLHVIRAWSFPWAKWSIICRSDWSANWRWTLFVDFKSGEWGLL